LFKISFVSSSNPAVPDVAAQAAGENAAAPPRQRLASLDAFRGFTIAGMIFVIMVAGYKNLPMTFPAFGSAPVSTWKHAGEDFDPEEWAHWHADWTYRQAKIAQVLGHGKYKVAVTAKESEEGYWGVTVRHPKPLQTGDDVIAVFPNAGGRPSFQGVGNGCTFTDLIAPFFVFIVGVAIPLSRRRHGADWWKHVGTRTLMLIGVGVLYIALALKGLSWWWGILQAIGIAYFIGATFLLLPTPARWAALALLTAAHAALSWYVPWWTHLPADMSHGFYTLANPMGDKLAPLNVHTTPWGSLGYGIITIIGTFVGEALLTRDHRQVLRRSLLLGLICAGAGYAIHRLAIPMNKDNVSISYSLFTAGAGALCFLVFYWVMDIKRAAAWAWPLNVFGANPLLAYFLQPIIRILFVQLGIYAWFGGHSGWPGMGWGLLWTSILWCACLYCNKRGFYWKL
jgi:predicted acyltransferase